MKLRLAPIPLRLLALCALAGCEDAPRTPTVAGDPDAGRRLIAAQGCGVCHVIPGVRGARGVVGPSLAGFARRSYIAGILPNAPDKLAAWIRDPPSFAPDSAMPRVSITPRAAQDVAAYLYTLR